MLNWDQMDVLHDMAQNEKVGADQRMSDIQDKMREWGALVNEGQVTSDYIKSHETTYPTYSAPIDAYAASLTKDARPDFPDISVEGPTWYEQHPGRISYETGNTDTEHKEHEIHYPVRTW